MFTRQRDRRGCAPYDQRQQELLRYESREPLRSLEVRGRLVGVTEMAIEHVDLLSVLHTRRR
jgi:hypothetical protein